MIIKLNVIDKFHLMTKNPEFIGRRDTDKGINWIGDGTGLFCPTSKTIFRRRTNCRIKEIQRWKIKL